MTDADDASGPAIQRLATVELSVSNGTLVATLAGGASFSAGANGSGGFTLSGSQADINATLATLRYQGNLNFNGTDTLVVRSTDGMGATDVDSKIIVVTPVNDTPVGLADVGSGTEDTPFGGNVLANDSDVDGPALSVTQFSVAGIGGSFAAGATANIAGVGALVINADGSYVFTPAADYNGAVPIATYTVSDGSLTGTTTLTLSIGAVNDAPVAVADVGSATEDVALTKTAVTGVLANDSDVDAGDSKTVSGVAFGATNGTLSSGLAGTYGTLTLNADGSYSYLADKAAAQALGLGQTATEVFTYTMRDAAGATSSTSITFTITGTNDAPVAAADVGGATEDIALTATAVTGVLANDSDVDAGDTKTVSGVAFGATNGTVGSALAGTYGTLTLNANGSYSYLADKAAAQALGLGQTATEAFTYTTRDAAGATTSTTITFTITGSNDAPIAVADSGSATEDVTLTTTAATGLLANDSDVDAGDTRTVSAVGFGATSGSVGSGLAGNYGTLTLNADGSYSYLADKAAAQALGLGQTATEVFSYTTQDAAGAASSSSITFTITGTNDAPLAVADTGSATEDVTLTTTALTGVLANDSDVDAGDSKTVSGVAFGATNGSLGSGLAGTYGTLTLNANGSYSYLADKAAAQALGLGQTATEVFTYTMRDAVGATSSTTLTFTITGSNDAPVAVANVGSVTEDIMLATTAATTGTVGSGLAGTYGTLTLNADGSYSYLANKPAAEALASGQTASEVFTYTTRDAAGATSSTTLSFTITGTDDAPIAGSASARLSEEGLSGANADTAGATDTTNSTSASGSIALSDIDNASLTVTLGAPASALTSGGTAITWLASNGGHTLTGSAGAKTIVTATIDDSGNYTLTLSGPVDHSDTSAEDVKSFGIVVNVSDGITSASGTLTVGIEDDSPVIGTPASAILYDGAGVVAEGALHLSTGADSGGASKVVFAGTSVDASGFITANRIDQTGAVVSSGFLTYNGSKLHYVSGANGSLTAMDASNTAVYTATGDPASGRYSVTMLHTLDPVQVTTAVFGTVTAGNNGGYTFSDGSNTFDLSVAGYAADGSASTVNTTSSTFGVGNNFIDSGEKLVFGVHAHGSGNPTQVSGMSVTAVNLGSGETLSWTAFDASNNQVGQGFVAGSGGNNDVSLNLTSSNFSGGSFSTIQFGGATSTSYKLQLNSLIGNSESLGQVTTIGRDAVGGADLPPQRDLHRHERRRCPGRRQRERGAQRRPRQRHPGRRRRQRHADRRQRRRRVRLASRGQGHERHAGSRHDHRLQRRHAGLGRRPARNPRPADRRELGQPRALPRLRHHVDTGQHDHPREHRRRVPDRQRVDRGSGGKRRPAHRPARGRSALGVRPRRRRHRQPGHCGAADARQVDHRRTVIAA